MGWRTLHRWLGLTLGALALAWDGMKDLLDEWVAQN